MTSSSTIRGRPPSLTPKQIRECARYRRQGMTYREIGKLLQIPYPTVYRACTAFQDAVSVIRNSTLKQPEPEAKK